jgi:hypothetical protein
MKTADPLCEVFWVFTWRRFLVRNQRFGTACLQGVEVNEEKDVTMADK